MILLMGGLVALKDFAASMPGMDTWQVRSGQHGTLQSGAQYTAVIRSKSGFEDWLRAEIARDNYGKVQLAATGEAVLVPSGAEVLVLELGHVSVSNQAVALSKVRVLNGPSAGSVGWAAAKHVAK